MKVFVGQRFKAHNAAAQAAFIGGLLEGFQQLLMPQVHAIEVANGQCTPLMLWLQIM